MTELKNLRDITLEMEHIFYEKRYRSISTSPQLILDCLNGKYGNDFVIFAIHILDQYLDDLNVSGDSDVLIHRLLEYEVKKIGLEAIAECLAHRNSSFVEQIIGSRRFNNIDFMNTLQSTMSYQSSINLPQSSRQRTAIIIHGTNARKATWWQKNGSFWSYLDSVGVPVTDDPNPFSWSGRNSDKDRYNAANSLVNWANAKQCELDIYAHSHGGNVALLATRLGLNVRKLVLMGTPIRYEYMPDISKIDKLYNIFSVYDPIQKVGTFPNKRGDGRTLSDTDKILNCIATQYLPNIPPGHSELHEPDTWKNSQYLAGVAQA